MEQKAAWLVNLESCRPIIPKTGDDVVLELILERLHKVESRERILLRRQTPLRLLSNATDATERDTTRLSATPALLQVGECCQPKRLRRHFWNWRSHVDQKVHM